MVNFIIAGLADCPNYARSLYIAKYLENHLPNFKVVFLPFDYDEWVDWLINQNEKFKWHHNQSPLIYKELLHHGGIPYLIGSVSEFWEYCYDYYGLESILSQEDINKLVKSNLESFELNNFLLNSKKEVREILIYGIKEKILHLLLPRLFEIDGLLINDRISITFYEDNFDEETTLIFENLSEVLKDEYNTPSVLTDHLTAAIKDVDLLIILDSTYMLSIEELINKSTIIKIHQLADVINHSAKRSLKVLFANDGMTCFAATLLYQNCDFKVNVAVVTSDSGLAAVEFVSQQFHLDKHDLCAPPVWGFYPSEILVDINSTLIKSNVHKPYERAIKTSDHSDLPLGTVYTEFRPINYFTYEEPEMTSSNIAVYRKKFKDKTGKISSSFSKLTSLLSVLKIWFSPDSNKSAIISLGVPGNGTFGIPNNLVFSQPVILKNDVWEPFGKYPVNHKTSKEIEYLVKRAQQLINYQELLANPDEISARVVKF